MRNLLNTWLAACAMLLWFAAPTIATTGQSSPDQNSTTEQAHEQNRKPGAVREIGGGAGSAVTGAAKATGDVAKGGGKAAADAVTLHPIDAAGSAGKGVATAGKDVTVGSAKGAGKITKGIGRVFKKIF